VKGTGRRPADRPVIFSPLWIARQAKKATIIGSGRLSAARPFWRPAD
jgi:hypothetical protein